MLLAATPYSKDLFKSYSKNTSHVFIRVEREKERGTLAEERKEAKCKTKNVR